VARVCGMAREPRVRCGGCRAILAEPPHTPPEKRQVCARCGEKNRPSHKVSPDEADELGESAPARLLIVK